MSTNKTGLGRGLSALLPETDLTNSSTGSAGQDHGFQTLRVELIIPNPRQPRNYFDDEAIDVLADSVRRLGVLQPLIVRTAGDRYELIAGERRLRAAKRVGLSEVPVLIKDATDEESLEQALLENLHREDLNPLEEAAAYKQLLDDFALTHEQLAHRVGRSRATVTNTMRLLGLPGEVQELVVDGGITGGHARALLGLQSANDQIALAAKIVSDGLTVRQTEELVKQSDASKAKANANPAKPSRHPALLEVGDLMGEYLSTKVDVKMARNSGKMVIEFGSLADLERIAQLILGPIEG